MTCADATDLLWRFAKHPESTSRSERVAYRNHYRTCPACAAFLRKLAEEEAAEMTRDQLAQQITTGRELAAADLFQSKMDPEGGASGD